MRISGPSDEPQERQQRPERRRASRGGGAGFLQALRRPGTTAPAEREIDWRAYDPIAETYARVMAPRTAVVAADLVRAAGVTKGSRVLDVGTGTGVALRAAAAVAGPDGRVVGVDVAHGMLLAARQDGGLYVQAAALDLPFRDGTFTHVLGCFVLTHFTRYETALFDMLRVLASRGRLAVTTWGPSHDEFSKAWDEVAMEFAGKEMLGDAYRRAMPWSERFADRGALKDALYEAGVRDIDVERRGYRFHMSAEDYLQSREIAATGRFLREMLGDRLWPRFQERTRAVFAERFPPAFNDFRDVNLAVGTKP